MIFSSSLLENAVTEFSKLPGIGKKTALRLILHLLKKDLQQVSNLSESLLKMRRDIKFCKKCHNVADEELCKICTNYSRKKNQICVVENIRDVMAIEATQQFNGTYHVLDGMISPLDGVGPDQLQISSLLSRIETDEVVELIMALSPTIEGDTTTYYIAKKMGTHAVKITTLSRGVAFGGELEYADELTLSRSFTNRLPIETLLNGSSSNE
ncbi:MAG: recombination protein RecR [Bacteroidetes bacterium]|nr:recombination protein RecR [Bacteroidota bacterium]